MSQKKGQQILDCGLFSTFLFLLLSIKLHLKSLYGAYIFKKLSCLKMQIEKSMKKRPKRISNDIVQLYLNLQLQKFNFRSKQIKVCDLFSKTAIDLVHVRSEKCSINNLI